MRTNLIMHFHCAECGKQLHIDDKPKMEPKYHYDDFPSQKPKEPTGAACHYTPKISVKPCSNCIEKYTGPAKKIVDAISAMTELNKT